MGLVHRDGPEEPGGNPAARPDGCGKRSARRAALTDFLGICNMVAMLIILGTAVEELRCRAAVRSSSPYGR